MSQAQPIDRSILTVLNRFPKTSCRSRAHYKEITGKDAPAHRREKPRKLWWDPEAANSQEDMIAYPRVMVGSTPDGPVFRTKFLTPEDAANVNIPPGEDANEELTNEPEITPPLRQTTDAEVVIRKKDSLIVLWEVWDRADIPPLSTGGLDFTKDEKELLLSAARHELARP